MYSPLTITPTTPAMPYDTAANRLDRSPARGMNRVNALAIEG